MTFRILGMAAGLALASSLAVAQTVTVNASLGSPDNVTTFTSLDAAMESFQAGGANAGAAAANVIEIDASGGAIEEVIYVTDATAVLEDVQVVGVNGRAVIRPQSTALTGTPDGLELDTDANVTFLHLAFIPPVTNAASDDLVRVREGSAGGNIVRFEDCIFTSADIGGNPVVTSKADALIDHTGDIFLTPGDDFLNPYGSGPITVEMVDCVVSHGAQTGTSPDGVVDQMAPGGPGVPTLYVESCVFSYLGRYGLQVAGDGALDPNESHYEVTGTDDSPSIFYANGNSGIAGTGGSGLNVVELEVDNSIFQANGRLTGIGVAIRTNATVALTRVDNVVAADAGVGFYLQTNYDFSATYTKVTFHNNTEVLLLDPGATMATTQNISITDCLITDADANDLVATNLGGGIDGGAWAVAIDSSTVGTGADAIGGDGPTAYLTFTNRTDAPANYTNTSNLADLGTYFATSTGDGASFTGPAIVSSWQAY